MAETERHYVANRLSLWDRHNNGKVLYECMSLQQKQRSEVTVSFLVVNLGVDHVGFEQSAVDSKHN